MSPGHQLFRLSAATRGFVLLLIAVPILWTQDVDAVLALGGVAAVWVSAQAATAVRRVPILPLLVVEATSIGLISALALQDTRATLLAFAVSPLLGALFASARGMALALAAELTTFLVLALVLYQGLSTQQSLDAFTWVVTGLGLGLVATFVRSSGEPPPDDELAPYRHAQSLIRELIDLSDGLSSGLDLPSLSGSILSTTDDTVPTVTSVLFVPRGETLATLLTRGDETRASECLDVAAECQASGDAVLGDRTFAIPLADVAIVAGVTSGRIDLGGSVRYAITGLPERLSANTVHLETALLFSRFRDAATADERRRLAREMHDGVAQDIASLGYLVDALAAKPASEQQAKALGVLRERISAVVAEVRQSVLTLRTSVGENESLGAALSSVARHLSESSGVPIQVTLDEQPARLPPEVEAELFRIAQEAMTNAVNHAQASCIDVVCQVYPPAALISVADDGRGLQAARDDSYGLKIMRERAELISARLDLSESPGGGLTVTVQVGPRDTGLRVPTAPSVEKVST